MVRATFKDPIGLTRFLKLLLVVYAAVAGFAIISSWTEYTLLAEISRGVTISESQAEANVSRQAAVELLGFIVMVITAVIFLMWIHRANSNARALGAKGMEFTPGWAVGYFFVPFLFLWKPYQAVREIYQTAAARIQESSDASLTPSLFGRDNWRSYPTPVIFKVWWMLWVVSNLVAQAYLSLVMKAEELSDLQAVAEMDIFSGILDILLCIAALMVVSKIFNLQIEKYRALRSLGQTPV